MINEIRNTNYKPFIIMKSNYKHKGDEISQNFIKLWNYRLITRLLKGGIGL